MARLTGDNTRPVMLTADSARRIAKAVQAYEQGRVNIKAKPLRTAGEDGAPLILAYVPDEWPRASSQVVDVLLPESCGNPGPAGSGSGSDGAEQVTAWNLFYDIQQGAIVLLTQTDNQCWYVVQASCGEADGGCQCVAIGGHDLTQLENYKPEEKQLLGHSDGCLQWFDTSFCEEEGSSS